MNKIEKFKNFIRFIVSIFASREFAFIYCIVGTLSQTAHTYYLVESISSLNGYWKIAQALGLSLFISSSLLFFTAIAPSKDETVTKGDKNIHLAVNLFMIIEIIINFYYYASHLIIKPKLAGVELNIFDFIFAILVSCLIPVTIKLYAGIIQAKEWLQMLEQKDKAKVEIQEKSVQEKEEPIQENTQQEEKPISNNIGLKIIDVNKI